MEEENVIFNYLKTEWQKGFCLSRYMTIQVIYGHMGDEIRNSQPFIAYSNNRHARGTSLGDLIM